MTKTIALIAAAAALAACAPKLQPTTVSNEGPMINGKQSQTIYAESEYSVPHAQGIALKEAARVCGARGLDAFPSNEASKSEGHFGKVGYNLVFTCDKLGEKAVTK